MMHQQLSWAIPLSYSWDVQVGSLEHVTKLTKKAHPRHVTHQTTLCNSSSLSSHNTENKTDKGQLGQKWRHAFMIFKYLILLKIIKYIFKLFFWLHHRNFSHQDVQHPPWPAEFFISYSASFINYYRLALPICTRQRVSLVWNLTRNRQE